MYGSVYDLKSFYNTKIGRVVRRIIKARIMEFWGNTKDLRVMGCGYAIPYLREFLPESERVIAIMPAAQGAHAWPQNCEAGEQEKNLVCLSEETEIPLGNSTIDRVLLIHNLEFSEFPKAQLSEIWRVLKPNGRVLVIVPSRSGLWARADWSPLGQGKPYSLSQIIHLLRDHKFVLERNEHGLFYPPVQYSLFMRLSMGFEKIGAKILPFMGGIHLIEVSKQLYASADGSAGSKVKVRGRALIGDALPEPSPRLRKTRPS